MFVYLGSRRRHEEGVEIIPAQDFFQNLGEFLNFPDGGRA